MANAREMTGVVDPAVTPTSKDQIVKNLIMTPEAEEFLNELAQQSGLSVGDVLLLGLGMLRTAIDAKQQGKHFGVAQNSEDLEIELVGF